MDLKITLCVGPVAAALAAALVLSPVSSRASEGRPAALAEVYIDADDVVAGKKAEGAVMLDKPYAGETDRSGLTVELASDNENAKVPRSVVVPAGQKTAGFTIAAAAGIDAPQKVKITATLPDGKHKTAIFMLKPAASARSSPALSNVALDADSIVGGGEIGGKLTLSAKAPHGGAVIDLEWDTPNLPKPKSITIPAGQDSSPFSLRTKSLKETLKAKLTASYRGAAKTITLTIKAQR